MKRFEIRIMGGARILVKCKYSSAIFLEVTGFVSFPIAPMANITIVKPKIAVLRCFTGFYILVTNSTQSCDSWLNWSCG